MPPSLMSARRNPYVGPRSFRRDAEEAKLFFGREEEARQLLVRVQTERLTLFYAESGAGKSSLLNTRLIPGLEERGYVVLPVGRVSGAPPAQMMGEIDNIFAFNLMDQIDDDTAAPQRYAKATLSAFLKRLVSDDGVRFRFDPNLKPPPANPEEAVPYVLIIDQFEELLTTHPGRWLDRENFFRQLDQAMRDDPNLWVVLSLREDFVARIEPYAPLLADRMRGRFYMQRMQEQQALDAVRLPAQQFDRPFAPEAAQALVDNLRQVRVAGEETAPGQYVEPVQLQVVCLQLWESLNPSAGHNITLADLERLAGGRSLAEFVDQALMDFYTRSLAEVLADPAVKALPDVSEAALRRFFSQQLITELGTRGFVLQGESQTGALPNGVLHLLRDRYLLRAENRAGGLWYELVHDRFVEPIQHANQAWSSQNLSPLQKQATLWDEQNRPTELLFSGTLLVEAENWANEHKSKMDSRDNEFLKASKLAQLARQRDLRQTLRIRQFASVTLLFSVLALAAFIWSFDLRATALLAERASVEARAIAATSVAESYAERAIADQSVAESIAARATAEITYMEAERQSRITQAQILASTALELSNERFHQRDLSRLLIAQAVRLNPVEGRNIHWLLDRSLRAIVGNSLVTTFGTGYQIFDAVVSPDGRYIFAASVDKIYRWNIQYPEKEPVEFLGHVGPITSIAVSPDGNRLVSASLDATIRMWDIVSGDQLITFAGHTDAVSSVAINPDGGSQIASASWDSTVNVWDSYTGEELTKLVGHTDGVLSVSYSPDGQTLVTAGADGTLRRWDSMTGHLLMTITGDEYFSSAAFSPDGRLLATGGSDFNVKLWDISSGQLQSSLPCHLDAVTAVAFSPSQDKLASAGSDNAICVWDMDNLIAPPAVFAGHADRTNSVAFTPDATGLVSSSNDGTVRLWVVDLNTMVDIACNQVKRNMTDEEWNTYLPNISYELTCPNFGSAN